MLIELATMFSGFLGAFCPNDIKYYDTKFSNTFLLLLRETGQRALPKRTVFQQTQLSYINDTVFLSHGTSGIIFITARKIIFSVFFLCSGWNPLWLLLLQTQSAEFTLRSAIYRRQCQVKCSWKVGRWFKKKKKKCGSGLWLDFYIVVWHFRTFPLNAVQPNGALSEMKLPGAHCADQIGKSL